jgi:hypothetical protein
VAKHVDRNPDALGSPGPFSAQVGQSADSVYVMSAPAEGSMYGHFVAKVHRLNAESDGDARAGQIINARLLAASWRLRQAVEQAKAEFGAMLNKSHSASKPLRLRWRWLELSMEAALECATFGECSKSLQDSLDAADAAVVELLAAKGGAANV